jgi:hypothetical protein
VELGKGVPMEREVIRSMLEYRNETYHISELGVASALHKKKMKRTFEFV